MPTPSIHPLRLGGAVLLIGALVCSGLNTTHAHPAGAAITTITVAQDYGNFASFPAGMKLYSDYKRHRRDGQGNGLRFHQLYQKVLQLAQTQSLPDVLVFDPSVVPQLAGTDTVKPIDGYRESWGQQGHILPRLDRQEHLPGSSLRPAGRPQRGGAAVQHRDVRRGRDRRPPKTFAE